MQVSNLKEENKHKKKNTLKRLIQYSNPDKWHIIGAMSALIVSSATNIAFPAIIGKVLDQTTQKVDILEKKFDFLIFLKYRNKIGKIWD